MCRSSPSTTSSSSITSGMFSAGNALARARTVSHGQNCANAWSQGVRVGGSGPSEQAIAGHTFKLDQAGYKILLPELPGPPALQRLCGSVHGVRTSWIKPRRDRKMAKKQVHTMAKAEKVAPGSDWHIPLRTADAELVCGYKRTAECTLFQKSDEHPCSGWLFLVEWTPLWGPPFGGAGVCVYYCRTYYKAVCVGEGG